MGGQEGVVLVVTKQIQGGVFTFVVELCKCEDYSVP